MLFWAHNLFSNFFFTFQQVTYQSIQIFQAIPAITFDFSAPFTFLKI